MLEKVKTKISTPLGIALAAATLLPAASAIGAYQGSVVTPYIAYLAVAVITILVAVGRLKHLPIYIFAISLSLLWQVSMIGVYVIGSDVTGEVLASSIALEGGWNWATASQSGSSIVAGLIVPWISEATTLSVIMVYKLFIPLIFAFTPVVLFYAFRNLFGETRAFFATLFFMIMPVFNLEIVTIGKSMVAELFFALIILTMVSNWKAVWKAIAMVVLLSLTAACHYTIGILAIFFLAVTFGIRLVTCRLHQLPWSNSRVSPLVIALSLVITGGLFYVYYINVSGGLIIRVLTSIGFDQAAFAKGLVMPNLQARGPFVRAAIGLDFLEVSAAGMVFRVLQYITQALIVVGAVWMLFRHKLYKVTSEFASCVFAAFLLLALCVLLPGFANVINMTRFYHTSLFFLAPMLVLGCDAIASIPLRRSK